MEYGACFKLDLIGNRVVKVPYMGTTRWDNTPCVSPNKRPKCWLNLTKTAKKNAMTENTILVLAVRKTLSKTELAEAVEHGSVWRRQVPSPPRLPALARARAQSDGP